MIHLLPSPGSARRPLPSAPPDTKRWGVICKAAAAVAVMDGHLSEHEACDLFDMKPHELEVWQHVVRDHGLRKMLVGRL